MHLNNKENNNQNKYIKHKIDVNNYPIDKNQDLDSDIYQYNNNPDNNLYYNNI